MWHNVPQTRQHVPKKKEKAPGGEGMVIIPGPLTLL